MNTCFRWWTGIKFRCIHVVQKYGWPYLFDGIITRFFSWWVPIFHLPRDFHRYPAYRSDPFWQWSVSEIQRKPPATRCFHMYSRSYNRPWPPSYNPCRNSWEIQHHDHENGHRYRNRSLCNAGYPCPKVFPGMAYRSFLDIQWIKNIIQITIVSAFISIGPDYNAGMIPVAFQHLGTSFVRFWYHRLCAIRWVHPYIKPSESQASRNAHRRIMGFLTAFMFISFIRITSSMHCFLLKARPVQAEECRFTPLNLIFSPLM